MRSLLTLTAAIWAALCLLILTFERGREVGAEELKERIELELKARESEAKPATAPPPKASAERKIWA